MLIKSCTLTYNISTLKLPIYIYIQQHEEQKRAKKKSSNKKTKRMRKKYFTLKNKNKTTCQVNFMIKNTINKIQLWTHN